MQIRNSILQHLVSFRGRLTLWFGGITFATLLIVGVYVGRIATSEISSAGSEALFMAARTAADLLTTNLRERAQEINLLSYSPALTKGDLARPEIRKQLDRRKAVHNEYAWIGVTNVDGVVLQATDGILSGEQVGHRPWFKGALINKLYVGDVHEAVLLAKSLPNVRQDQPLRFIDFAAPIRDENGKLRGILGAHAHWAWVTETVETVITEQAAQREVDVLIMDKTGNVLYPWELIGLRVPTMAHPESHYEMLEWADGRYLTSIVPVKESIATPLDWSVVLRQPVSAAIQPIEALHYRLIWSGLFASLFIAVLAYRFASRISRPIEQLVTAVEHIEKRDEQPNFPGNSNVPEIDQLAQVIQSTTRSLLDRELQLENLNSSLEQLVEERTEALVIVNQQLERLAISDALTGVNNRRRFDEKLHEFFVAASRGNFFYSLLLIDVDHFKKINDTFGHPVGDVVLQLLASLLQAEVRETDFVARYGGEEFVVLLTGIREVPEALHVAEKLRSAIAAHDFPDARHVTISLGLSLSNVADEQETEIVRRADSALYSAKRNGRNRVEVNNQNID